MGDEDFKDEVRKAFVEMKSQLDRTELAITGDPERGIDGITQHMGRTRKDIQELKEEQQTVRNDITEIKKQRYRTVAVISGFSAGLGYLGTLVTSWLFGKN